MACRGSTDERSMRYLRFRIIADRAEASHACSRRTVFFGREKTERLTRCRSLSNGKRPVGAWGLVVVRNLRFPPPIRGHTPAS